MATELTPNQHTELKQHGDKPMQVIDPIDQKIYFIVAGDLFERVQALLDDTQFDVREMYPVQALAAAQTGWDDPVMDEYNDYDANKPKS